MYLIPPHGPKRKYEIRFRNHDGRTVKVSGDRDEQTAKRIADRIGMLVRAKQAGDPPPSELNAWIANMPETMASRLVELGLLDGSKREVIRPINDHIDEYVKVVAARKNNTYGHARQQGNRVRRVFRELKLSSFSRITSDDVLVKVASWDVSASTRRHYLVAMKDFAKWMGNPKRAGVNPLSDMPVPGMYEDPVIERIPLTVQEVQKLMDYLDTFETYPHQISRWTASHRKLLYWTAIKTGFRKSELASLKKSNLHLREEPPKVSIKARSAKNKTAGEVPIPADLAAALAKHAKTLEPNDKLFNFPSGSGSVVEMFRKDLTGAGIPWRLDDCEVRDFHTLRATAICFWLDVDGLKQKRVQILARLKVGSVLEKYSRNLRLQDFGWLNKGPKLVNAAKAKRQKGRENVRRKRAS